MNGRRMAHPRGRVLGGCSSINAMVYQRATRWTSTAGPSTAAPGAGTTRTACRTSSASSPATSRRTEPWRGYSGPQRIERGPVTNPCSGRSSTRRSTAGHPSPGHERPGQRGLRAVRAHHPQRTPDVRGPRVRAPGAHRRNLEVRCNALVTGVVFQGSRAVGVRYVPQGPAGLRRGATERFVPAGEVILAGGAINSPQLLQLSGDRERGRAAALDVPVVARPARRGRGPAGPPGRARPAHLHPADHVRGPAPEKRNWPSIGAQWLVGHSGPGPRPRQVRARTARPEMTIPVHRGRPAVLVRRRADRPRPARPAGSPRTTRASPTRAGTWSPTSRSSTGSPAAGRPVCTRRRRAGWGTDAMAVVDPASMAVHGVEGPAGGGRVGDAVLPQRRHARADDDARRAGVGPDPRPHPDGAASTSSTRPPAPAGPGTPPGRGGLTHSPLAEIVPTCNRSDL